MLGAGSEDRLSTMEAHIIGLLDHATSEDLFFAAKLADLLKTYHLGRSHAAKIADKLEGLADELQEAGNHYTARAYFADASAWFTDSSNEEKSVQMTVAQAETWVTEAEARLSSDIPSNFVAASFFHDAIQTYRTIPRTHREKHQVNQRMEEIRRYLEEAGQRSLEEMSLTEGPTIDLEEPFKKVRELVSDKPAVEAIMAFANMLQTDANKLREAAAEGMSRSPLRAFISTAMITHDGRVGARIPGLTGETPSEGNEATIEAETIRYYYDIQVTLAAQLILYGLRILNQEHRLREEDLIRLARHSPTVPPDREILFGKALYQGFNQDFATAIHLMAPQIENLVRFQLKLREITTTHLDEDGIETENGLSTLIEIPEVSVIFGGDTAFEIKALFCSPYGGNLRNNIAHGLLNDAQCYTTHTVYACG